MRWNGKLRQQWELRLRLRGVLFLAMMSQAQGMNAEQATDMLTRIMDLFQAATNAAQTASTMMQQFQGARNSVKFGDGARVLKSPDVFDTDDPVRYSFWREQFLNWLVFCDGRYMVI